MQEACPVRSSVTDQPCLLPKGHTQDTPNRFHRYARLESDTRTYEQRFEDLEKRVTELEDWRAGMSTPSGPPPLVSREDPHLGLKP